MPKFPEYDFVVLGGGSAGYAAARTAVELGLKTAVVEGGLRVGGLCILRGCMPTKALLETAHRLHECHRAPEFGLTGGKPPRPDWKKVVARKNRLIADFAGYRQKQLKDGSFDFFRARGRFIDEYHLKLEPLRGKGGKQPVPDSLKFRTLLISTGSEVAPPPIPGLEEVGYLTSDDAIHLTQPPKSLAVLGGGPIAVEFADYFLRMGVQVTLIQRSPHILKGQDDDVGAEVEKAFRHDGMKVFTGTQMKKVRFSGRQKVVEFGHEGKMRKVQADEILYALGRQPATARLGLDQAGIRCKGKAVSINKRLQSNRPHIFAAGDVSGPYEIVHVAIEQGEAAAKNAAILLGRRQGKYVSMQYRTPMEIVFCEPEVASVGMTEQMAKAAKVDYIAASYPFDDHGKSIIKGARFGFVKCLADRKNGRLIGAQIVGPGAADLIHEFSVALTFNATIEKFLKVPHYHPTLAEIVTYPVEEIAEELGRI